MYMILIYHFQQSQRDLHRNESIHLQKSATLSPTRTPTTSPPSAIVFAAAIASNDTLRNEPSRTSPNTNTF